MNGSDKQGVNLQASRTLAASGEGIKILEGSDQS